MYIAAVPDGIAVDVINQFIYYTDTGLDVIARMRYTGADENIIVVTGLDQPRGIVLRIAHRLFYTSVLINTSTSL